VGRSVLVAVVTLAGCGRIHFTPVADATDATDAAPACHIAFGAHVEYRTGASPYSIAMRDFDGDGNLDIAAAALSSNVVSVLRGDGAGHLLPRQDFATGMGPIAIAAGDISGDGKLDLVTANYNASSVSVLIGNGDATFQAHRDTADTAATSPYGVAVGDFDGTGGLDVALARQGDLAARVMSGFDGNVFTTGTTANVTHGQLALAVGRLDADAQDDLALEAGNAVGVLIRTGTSFLPVVLYPTGVGPSSVLAVDLDGDGTVDLATANSTDGTVSVLLGNGDGTFQAKRDFPADTGAYAIAAADLDRDGKLDIVTANYMASTVSVLFGNGDGTFGAPSNVATGQGPNGIAIGDLDHDGVLDLVTTDDSIASASVLLGQCQ
jgi:hypothetical protein